jgi:hypothetical protein
MKLEKVWIHLNFKIRIRNCKAEANKALIPNVRISTVSIMKFYLNSGNEIEFK